MYVTLIIFFSNGETSPVSHRLCPPVSDFGRSIGCAGNWFLGDQLPNQRMYCNWDLTNYYVH